MPIEELEALTALIERIGLIGLVVLAIVIIMILWAKTASNSQNTLNTMSQNSLTELVQLRKDYKEVVNSKFLLEKEYTICRDEGAGWRSRYEVLESKNQAAVDKFLDDSQDYDREMIYLRLELKDKDKIIQDKTDLITFLKARIEGQDLHDGLISKPPYPPSGETGQTS